MAEANVVLRRPNLNSWAKEIDKLCADLQERRRWDENHAADEIAWLLKDHVEQIKQHNPYQPQAYCAKSFREKFPKILAAHERRQQDPQSRRHRDNGHIDSRAILRESGLVEEARTEDWQ